MLASLRHLLLTLLFLLVIAIQCLAQSGLLDNKKQPEGSISGRVTAGGKPLGGVTVIASENSMGSRSSQSLNARAVTDSDGAFKITGLKAGRFDVSPFSPVFAAVEESGTSFFDSKAKLVSVGEGEAITDVNFSLVRGGVITGRVTGPDGRTIIGARVSAIRVEEVPGFPGRFSEPETDDRGIYRIFGLKPGRYKISVMPSDMGSVANSSRVFYPHTNDQSVAGVVEVSESAEMSGIDITMEEPTLKFAAFGRVVDAQSGNPIANVRCMIGALNPKGGDGFTSFGSAISPTNQDGEFRLEGLVPGDYTVSLASWEGVDYYSDPIRFRIDSSDVSGLEIRANRGTKLSGVVVIEGSSDPEMLARINKVSLSLSYEWKSGDMPLPYFNRIPVGPDGSFTITGVRPGRVFLRPAQPVPTGLALIRIERDGVSQSGPIEISSNQDTSGIRIVLGVGTATIRGTVNVAGEKIENLRIFARAKPLSAAAAQGFSSVVDVRGRFSIESLPAGEYEVEITAFPLRPGASGSPPKGVHAVQTVTVSTGQESQVALNLDFNKPQQQ